MLTKNISDHDFFYKINEWKIGRGTISAWQIDFQATSQLSKTHFDNFDQRIIFEGEKGSKSGFRYDWICGWSIK